MYRIELRNYEDFTSKEQQKWCKSNNGNGKEYATYIVVIIGSTIIDVYSDAVEPEDATFTRDFSWITSALKDAYDYGFLKGVKKTC